MNCINNSEFGCVRGVRICAYCLPREFAWILWHYCTLMFTSRAVTLKLESVNHLSCSYLESAGGEERMKANAVAIFKHVLVRKKSVWKKSGAWTSHTVSTLQNTYLFYYHFQCALAPLQGFILNTAFIGCKMKPYSGKPASALPCACWTVYLQRCAKINVSLQCINHSNSPLSIKKLFLHQSMLKMFSLEIPTLKA